MNFELEDILREYVKKDDLATAIQIAEKELCKVPLTDFHKLIGKDLLHLETDLSKYLSKFYATVKRKYTFTFPRKLKAFYAEMNDFTINYDRWFLDLFAFSKLETGDDEWLADYDYAAKYDLTITGFEQFQKAYEDVHRNQKLEVLEIEQAYEIVELLIILRMQELFRETYKKAKAKGLKWSEYPMFITAHDYEMIYRIN